MSNEEEASKLIFTIQDDSVDAIPLEFLGELPMNSSIFIDSPSEYPKPGIFQTANQYLHYIFSILSYQSRRVGTFCQFHCKKILVLIIAIGLSYYLLSFLDLGPPATSRTEYSSTKLQFLRYMEHYPDYKKNGLSFRTELSTKLPTKTRLRKQLAHSIPYDRDTSLPKQIWQTWKVKLDDPKFPATFKNLSQTWTQKNPNYTHHILVDQECDQLVTELYARAPDVIHAYKIMPKPILKIDFFRYLILYAKGGVYSDMDTKALKPIDNWASNLESKKFNSTIYSDDPKNPGLVVGIEADPGVDQYRYFPRTLQFCQWTIQSKKGHPMLRELIARITETTLEREEMGRLDPNADIMEWTGPGIFSDYVFDYLNSIFDASSTVARRKYDRIFDKTFFTHMEQPILIEDALILPITSFSPDIGWMGAHESSDPMAYARHMFSGFWKDNAHDPT